MKAATNQRRGFSLVEILVVIAVIGVLAGVTIPAITGVPQSAKKEKLEQDVVVVNNAIDSYLASGGDPANLTPGNVISALKTRVSGGIAAEMMGPQGPFLEPTVITNTTDFDWSAVFTTDPRPRFVVVRGREGVIFGTGPATDVVGVAERADADRTSWLWSYAEATPPPVDTPFSVPSTAADSARTFGAALTRLNPPQISPASTVYTIGSSPSISMADPNSTSSRVLYGVGGAAVTTAYTAPFTLATPGPVVAQARSLDPSRYTDSEVASETYLARPLLANVPPAPASLTYAMAASGTNVVTISNNGGSIFDVFYTAGGGQITANSARYTGPIALIPSLWSNSATSTIQAQAFPNAGAGQYYTNSEILSVSVSAQSTQLQAPTITPPGQIVFRPLPVTISTDSSHPPGTRVFYVYTTNSAVEPTPETGTLYNGPFVVSEFGVNQQKFVKARAYAPADLSDFWFTPSSLAAQTYQGLNFAYYDIEGVLVGGGTIANNAALNGSVVLVSVPGQQPNVTFANNSVLTGDVYAPGTPIVNGVPTNRIVDLDGEITPTNYTVTINKADFAGKVYRRITPVIMPIVTLPTGLSTNTNTITGGTLAPGYYKNVVPGNGDTITIGSTNSTTEPTVYVFDQFFTGNKFTLNVVGPVRLILNPGATTVNIGNNVVLGNQPKPEWLQINMFTGNIDLGQGSTMYGSILNPNGTVSFSQGATFFGGVTAKFINIENGATGVVFGLPPPS